MASPLSFYSDIYIDPKIIPDYFNFKISADFEDINGHDNNYSIALGYQAATTDNNQFMIGENTTYPINIVLSGNLTVQGKIGSINGSQICTVANGLCGGGSSQWITMPGFFPTKIRLESIVSSMPCARRWRTTPRSS